MAKATTSDTRLEIVMRKVTLTGLAPLMFDRYAGDNQTKLEWSQKIYLIPGTNILCLPTTNIISFLSSHNTNSAPKRLRDARQFKKICNACLSFVTVKVESKNPDYIPILRNGKPIEVGKFGDEQEHQSGLYLDRRVARLDKGIPNPKERPCFDIPPNTDSYSAARRHIIPYPKGGLIVSNAEEIAGHLVRQLNTPFNDDSDRNKCAGSYLKRLAEFTDAMNAMFKQKKKRKRKNRSRQCRKKQFGLLDGGIQNICSRFSQMRDRRVLASV